MSERGELTSYRLADLFPPALRAKIAELPRGPGVYLMKDERGRVLYVGKALDLRARVGSYDERAVLERPRLRGLVGRVEDLEVIETPSEVEALLLESRLIKDLEPRCNSRLKDAKSYPYLAIEKRGDFPRVMFVRGRERRDLDYFGPFAAARGLRQALPLLQRVFRFRTCELDIAEGEERWRHFRPCLLASIGRCSAPCNQRITRAAYRRDIAALKRLLRGQRARLLAGLECDMANAAAELRYEEAARLRDQIKAIRSLASRALHGDYDEPGAPLVDPLARVEALRELLGLEHPPRVIEGVDIAHLQGEAQVGSLVSFVDGRPWKDGYRRYRIKTAASGDDYASIAEVLARRYRRVDRGEELASDLLLIDGGPGQVAAAAAALSAFRCRPTVLAGLAKREELIHVHGRKGPLRLEARSGALQLLQQVRDEAHRFARHYHHLLRSKALVEERPAMKPDGGVRNPVSILSGAKAPPAVETGTLPCPRISSQAATKCLRGKTRLRRGL